ncbi:MAG: FAD-dependent thymidylate synthase [Leptospirales bacterium]
MSFDLSSYQEKYSELLRDYDHIQVNLVDYPKTPYNLAIATARTCYSSKGLIYPDDLEKNDKSRELRDRIARSTLEAGHVTTRQHAHFVFAISGVSRNVIWQFLHSHPYYNSEQVSQRYVPIKGGDWFSLPPSLRTAEGNAHMDFCIKSYRELIEALTGPVSEVYFDIFRSRKVNPEKYAKDIEKKSMEVARYIMPLSTTAYLYHTISALTFYRYAKMLERNLLPEATVLILKMAAELEKVDPLLVSEIPESLEKISKEYDPAIASRKNREFDERLNKENLRSMLISHTGDIANKIPEIANLMRGGFSGNAVTLPELLDAEKNSYLSDPLYPVTLDEDSRVLNHMHFTFMKKLSHTADSQEQRHRTLPGSRPDLAAQVSLENDYIIPEIIKGNPVLLSLYNNIIEKSFDVIRATHKKGIPLHDVTSLLPNAFPVRFYESGDYLNFFHKWKSRLCYNAQEEIFYSTLDELNQVEAAVPELRGFIGPPCALRKTTKPRCPEGDRYCGVKVWKLSPSEYSRVI